MKKLIRFGFAAAAMASVGLAAVMAWPVGAPLEEFELEGDVARGAYLARAAGCIACHTDVANGGAPLAGGVRLATPFGTLVSPNLTTDPEHGLGGWTIEEFGRAVRQGVSPEGAPYYPAFTYPFYANFSDQEIADLWAAFRTVPPVAEAAPAHDMAFPFDQRWGLKLWRALFLEPPRTDPVAGKGEMWNRGRQLVEGAAHCAACHTARNLAGARLTDEAHLGGNDALPGGGKAPAIDAEALRRGGWTVDALAYALKTGLAPDGDAFGGSMGEVVLLGTGFLTDADRLAMAAYLLDEAPGT
ncbi:c-type cytochrome [Shimia sp.]|uniref:c-type cytochrome n=1 Tax=Shimia sp. TaxID=1954381 RepID=UPI00356B567D